MTYEQVRKRISELVPDVMKLELGCEVMVKEEHNSNVILHVMIGTVSRGGGAIYASGKDHYQQQYFVNNIIKILGRDPSLADVLRAIGEAKNHNYEISIGTDGGFLDDESHLNYISKWNLSKPLSGQSQEVLDFLGELIK